MGNGICIPKEPIQIFIDNDEETRETIIKVEGCLYNNPIEFTIPRGKRKMSTFVKQKEITCGKPIAKVWTVENA